MTKPTIFIPTKHIELHDFYHEPNAKTIYQLTPSRESDRSWSFKAAQNLDGTFNATFVWTSMDGSLVISADVTDGHIEDVLYWATTRMATQSNVAVRSHIGVSNDPGLTIHEHQTRP